jgi:hypothetical protein
VTGLVSLKREKKKKSFKKLIQKYNSNELDIGIRVSQLSTQFYKTKAITLSPRYIITNTCKRPIIVSQSLDSCQKQFYLEKDQETIYYFEHKNDENYLMLRQAQEDEETQELIMDKDKVDIDLWSCNFDIGNVADFQISFLSFETDKKKPKWYDPQKVNGYRRTVRVIVTTKDEASLFIILSDPRKPEFRIRNVTKEDIGYKQKGGRIKNFVAPKSCVPFVWEDVSPQATQILKLVTNDDLKEYSLEKIEEQDNLRGKKLYTVKTRIKKSYKEIVIKPKKKESQRTKAEILEHFIKERLQNKWLLFDLNIKGAGISIINSEPQEVLFLSVYKPMLRAYRLTEYTGKGKL